MRPVVWILIPIVLVIGGAVSVVEHFYGTASTIQLSHALVPPGSDHLISTSASEKPLRMGTVVDIDLGQFQSYDHDAVTLRFLTPNSRSRRLKLVGSFFANLCGPRSDSFPALVGFEKPGEGVRTFFPYSTPTHAIRVQTVTYNNRLYASDSKIPGHCRFLPTWIWVIRVRASVPGRYKWHGLVATYSVNGHTIREVLPQNAYDITWKNCPPSYQGKNHAQSDTCPA